jgi:hypothetical protein
MTDNEVWTKTIEIMKSECKTPSLIEIYNKMLISLMRNDPEDLETPHYWSIVLLGRNIFDLSVNEYRKALLCD